MARKVKNKRKAGGASPDRWANMMARVWRPPDIDKEAARKVWRALSFDRKLDLVEEIVETRSTELHRAYSGVIAISAGKKLRKGTVGATLREQTPAVIFVVRKKLAPREGRARTRMTLIPFRHARRARPFRKESPAAWILIWTRTTMSTKTTSACSSETSPALKKTRLLK